jgi:hypothetical protein
MRGKSQTTPIGRPFKKGDPRAGRPRGVRNKATVEVREIARHMVEGPTYQPKLVERLEAGKCHPSVETLMWHYAYGKPREHVKVNTEDKLDLAGLLKLALTGDNDREREA